jgi:catechol 2,3-dioxygenase-like lactoylglutathione lyase family enzyme
MNIERISAITLKVTDMARSVRFYTEILGLEIIYGGPHASFSSLRSAGAQDAILNLEQGTCSSGWGRLIFHVKDVDELWVHLKARGLDAARPRDASWGERYFHLHDPDGHELSFAKPTAVSTDCSSGVIGETSRRRIA